MPDRVAHRHDEARIGKLVQQKVEAGHLVIGFGEVTGAVTDGEELADVVAQEGRELGVAAGLQKLAD